VQHGSAPSAASGISSDAYQAACEAQDHTVLDPGLVVWLFEPRRSSKVIHWSGTNEYPAWHQNKLGSTLNAFSHYVYLLSQESIVLADLQSVFNYISHLAFAYLVFPAASAVNENGEGIQVLFDIMAHTTDGYFISVFIKLLISHV
jgi:hypothetical protein